MRGKAADPRPDVILRIRLSYDAIAGVWYVAESDIPGLRTEALGPDALAVRVGAAIVGLTDAILISQRRTEGTDDEH